MIIFNGKEEEYCEKYMISNIVVDIETETGIKKSLSSILEELMEHKIPEGVKIKAYGEKNTKLFYKFIKPTDNGIEPPYPWMEEELDDEDLILMDDDNYERPRVLREYEKYKIGYQSHKEAFEEVDIPEEAYTAMIADAIGILPNIYEIGKRNGISIKEQIELSKAGRDLMWTYADEEGTISKKNNYPDEETIRLYMKLSPYEKRIIREKGANYHPRAIIELVKRIKEGNPNRRLTTFDCQRFFNIKGYEYDKFEKAVEAIKYEPGIPYISLLKYNGTYNDITQEFIKKYHRVPRVIDEYIYAYQYSEITNSELRNMQLLNKLLIHDAGEEEVEYTFANFLKDKERLKGIVEKFSLANLSKVAKSHSITLYALCNKINFNEINNEHIQIFEVDLPFYKIPEYNDKGFFEWYNEHKDIKPSILAEILEKDIVKDIEYFNKEDSIEKILHESTQALGKKEAADFESYDETYHFKDNELAIKGRNIKVSNGKYTMFMLDKDDYRNFTIGIDTHCCQRFGNAGMDCVRNLTHEAFSGATVIVENKNMRSGQWVSGSCVAQAFTWVDNDKDVIVFDNMEFANDRQVSQFSDLIGVWAAKMPYKNMHVGTGFNQGMNGWGKAIHAEEMGKLPGRCDYSDYHSNARVLKRNGEMLLSVKAENIEKMEIYETELKPSVYDIFTEEKTRWLLSGKGSLDEKQEVYNAMNEDENKEETQERAYKINPNFIKYYDNICESVQVKIAREHKELITYIKNPLPIIYLEAIRENPYKILDINNPSREAWETAVEQNGLLLQYYQGNNEAICKRAVRNNGLAIKYIENPTIEEQQIAIRQTINALNFIKNPDISIILEATDKDISLIRNIENISPSLQLVLVRRRPISITYIKEPTPEVITEAIRRDGSLIRNYNYSEELRMLAVENKPIAIRNIPHPSKEVIMTALRGNESIIKYLRVTKEEKEEYLHELHEEQNRSNEEQKASLRELC